MNVYLKYQEGDRKPACIVKFTEIVKPILPLCRKRNLDLTPEFHGTSEKSSESSVEIVSFRGKIN